jgi:hypothetical protein
VIKNVICPALVPKGESYLSKPPVDRAIQALLVSYHKNTRESDMTRVGLDSSKQLRRLLRIRDWQSAIDSTLSLVQVFSSVVVSAKPSQIGGNVKLMIAHYKVACYTGMKEVIMRERMRHPMR